MARVDHDDEEQTKRGAFWSRFAMTLLSLRASLDSRVEIDRDPSGSGDGGSAKDSSGPGKAGSTGNGTDPRVNPQE